ncbi:MAG: N-formylglutamate amidohydrolase [Pseudomonadota bacterium]
MEKLLRSHEPDPVTQVNPSGGSPYFLTCEHAGRLIPEKLGDLGLSSQDRQRHIAWDIGIEAVSRSVSAALDAPLICQNYSRLVIDCNRQTIARDAIATVSEETEIPGNKALSPAEAAARAREIHRPYHDTIVAALDARATAMVPTILIAMHSFTPRFKGQDRPWHIGLLYNRDDRVARASETILAEEAGLVVGDNEPYAISDEGDYTIPVHGEQRGIPHLEFEIRQDLISHDAGVSEWADRITELLCRGLPVLRDQGVI